MRNAISNRVTTTTRIGPWLASGTDAALNCLGLKGHIVAFEDEEKILDAAPPQSKMPNWLYSLPTRFLWGLARSRKVGT